MVGALLVIGQREQRERCRRRLGLPHRLERRQLGLLVLGHRVARLVAEDDHRTRRGQPEGSSNAEGTAGEFDMHAAQQVPGTDAEDEDRAGDVAGRHGMDELRLRRRVEQQIGERGHLHAHGDETELGPDRVLHPAVGDQDPQRREVRGDAGQVVDHQVAALRQAVPAEEEETDEGRFEEEGHQPLDRQRRAEDVADVVRVISPVGAELELHGDAGGDAEREVDAEQLAPELGHVAVDFLAAHHIDRFHDGQQDRQTQRQGNEEEMVKSSGRELQPRQVDDCRVDHDDTPWLMRWLDSPIPASARRRHGASKNATLSLVCMHPPA
ncbi:hypothetical protein SDC9_97172 [bioreactor metagenome]|uniref:Uncharacterized protein n=1 Tax=bioreactor metagenome TaxID=1076179 RepID=A0A645AHU9_9ZZZZ